MIRIEHKIADAIVGCDVELVDAEMLQKVFNIAHGRVS